MIKNKKNNRPRVYQKPGTGKSLYYYIWAMGYNSPLIGSILGETTQPNINYKANNKELKNTQFKALEDMYIIFRPYKKSETIHIKKRLIYKQELKIVPTGYSGF